MHVLITIWSILAAWRWANWRRFREFHATILYMSAMNLLYYFLTVNYPLWTLQSNIGLPLYGVRLLHTFIVIPCTVILFLSNYPDTFNKQIMHIGKWVVIYIGVEWIGYLFGSIYYENGWSLGHSLLFLIVMFPMLKLHFKRPIFSYIASVIIITFLLNWFEVPLI